MDLNVEDMATMAEAFDSVIATKHVGGEAIGPVETAVALLSVAMNIVDPAQKKEWFEFLQETLQSLIDYEAKLNAVKKLH